MAEVARLDQPGRDGIVDQQGPSCQGQRDWFVAATAQEGDLIDGSPLLPAVEDLEDRVGGENRHQLEEVASPVGPLPASPIFSRVPSPKRIPC